MIKRTTPRHVTKKHLARAQRERRLRNWVLAGTSITLALVIGLVGYGAIQQGVIKPNQPVSIVQGEEISTKAFQGRVRISDAFTVARAQFIGQTDDLLSELADRQSRGQMALDELIEEALIRQEAQQRGIAVTDEDIDRQIEETYGYYRDGTPTPRPTLAPLPTSTESIAPTETINDEPTPTLSPTLTPFPTPTIFTFDGYQELFDEQLSTLKELYGVTEADYRNYFQASLYQERLMDEMSNQVPREQEHVWARHILVEDEETANEILEKLEAGQSWEDLALEYSMDEANKDTGGDLGWFPRGAMVPEFEETAFSTEVGQIGGPVQTEFGWHLIEVLGRESRSLDEYTYQQLVNEEFYLWLEEAREEADIEIFEYWKERIPPMPAFETGL